MTSNLLQLHVDPTSRSTLAANGLRFDLLDTADPAAFRAWQGVVAHAFLDSQPTAESLDEVRDDYRLHNRVSGVWDDSAAEPIVPVATLRSWASEVTVPGGTLGALAISSVTVAPTHRRRGIARALLEGELRAAVRAGLPAAMLTVSEATIYGRYGFGPAASVADLTIDTRRIRWAGPDVPGRVHVVSRDTALAAAPEVLERARLRTPGEVPVTGLLRTRLFGRRSDEALLRGLRYLRYDDAAGTPQGLAVYSVQPAPSGYSETVRLEMLSAATDDAYAALWRCVLALDLVTTVIADDRSVDEPVRWLVTDERAIRTTGVMDHQWVRVLDPVRALEARTYAGQARLAFEVADTLGHAAGRYLLEADQRGTATVRPIDAVEPGVAAVALDVSVLGSILLGGVSAVTLAAAGRIRELVPGSAGAVARAFYSPVTPWLSTWY